MGTTLKRAEILRGRSNFQSVLRRGRRIQGKLFRCLVLPSAGDLHPGRKITFGITVSRSVRRAVDRNRIKRLTRETYRLNKETLLSPLSARVTLLFIYSAGGKRAIPGFQEIEEDMKTILAAVAKGQFR